MKLAGKEAEESEFYLLLIHRAYVHNEAEELIKLTSINKILNKRIATTKAKSKNN